MVLDERITSDGLTLAGDPDDVGVSAADHPPPVFLGAGDRPGGPGVLHVVKGHQVAELDLTPGPNMPECARVSSTPSLTCGRLRLMVWANVCRPQTPQPSGR